MIFNNDLAELRNSQVPLQLEETFTALQKANEVLECRVQDILTESRHVYEQLSREIVERKLVEAELKNSLSLLQATLESTADGVIAIRCNGDIVSFHQKFVHMWQVPDSIISRNYNQCLTFYSNQLKNPETFCRHIHQLDSQPDFEGYDTLELKDGRVFERSCQPLRQSEQTIGTVWSFRDITERKQAEGEIRLLLEQEKQIVERRAHFVSMVSHELRTPLNIISYSTSLLKRHTYHWTEEKKLQYLQRLQTAVEQINQLMDEVLIIDTAEAGKLQCEPKPLDLNLFCRDLLAEMNLSKNSRQYTVTFVSQGESKAVCVDKKLLQPILTNLLSNAIKYSPTGSMVDLVLSYQDEKVIFQIKDRGLGIPVADRQQLFKLFTRGGNVGNIPGNGLGLAIVKKLVDIHSGQINLVSEVGVGTTFTKKGKRGKGKGER